MEQNGQQLTKRNTGTTAIATLRDLLEKSQGKLAQVVPKHLTPERITRIALAACSRTPKLLQCKPASVLNAVMQAAQLGLEPGGALGEAYLVPYGDECQFIPGYRGLISLARRSGQIVSIEAHVVHERDKFTCRYGLDSVLEHEPDWSEEPGQVIAVYAVAKLRDGGTQCEVMTKAQVDAIRKRSRASGSGPWVTDYEEMARKTVVRRLCKYLPLSVELAEALDLGESEEHGNIIDLPQAEQPAPQSRTEAVKAKLAAANKPAPTEPHVEPDEQPDEEGVLPDEPAPEAGEVRAPNEEAPRVAEASADVRDAEIVAWVNDHREAQVSDVVRHFRVSTNRARTLVATVRG